jgi:hypothetical protein
VAEWSKALAWKVSMGQKPIEGSNPSRSASHPMISSFLPGIFGRLREPVRAALRVQHAHV